MGCTQSEDTLLVKSTSAENSLPRQRTWRQATEGAECLVPEPDHHAYHIHGNRHQHLLHLRALQPDTSAPPHRGYRGAGRAPSAEPCAGRIEGGNRWVLAGADTDTRRDRAGSGARCAVGARRPDHAGERDGCTQSGWRRAVADARDRPPRPQPGTALGREVSAAVCVIGREVTCPVRAHQIPLYAPHTGADWLEISSTRRQGGRASASCVRHAGGAGSFRRRSTYFPAARVFVANVLWCCRCTLPHRP